jgi:DNA-binding MarR family transcriptional regulator
MPRRSAGPAADQKMSNPAAGQKKAVLSKEDFEELAKFRLALRRFLSFSEKTSRIAGISAQQYQAMLVIRAHAGPAMTIKDLAEQMLLLPHGAVQLVDRLVQAGLAERLPSDADRRSVLVALTPEGEQVTARLAVDHYAELIRRKPLLVESLSQLRKLGRTGGKRE